MRKMWFILSAAVLLGCADNSAERAVDRTDPQQVAEAFWKAVVAGDNAEAASYVVKEDRTALTRAFDELKGMKPLPDHPQIVTIIDGNRGEAIIENWEEDNDVDMVLRDGQWWISR